MRAHVGHRPVKSLDACLPLFRAGCEPKDFGAWERALKVGNGQEGSGIVEETQFKIEQNPIVDQSEDTSVMAAIVPTNLIVTYRFWASLCSHARH